MAFHFPMQTNKSVLKAMKNPENATNQFHFFSRHVTSVFHWKIFATVFLCFVAGEYHGSENINIVGSSAQLWSRVISCPSVCPPPNMNFSHFQLLREPSTSPRMEFDETLQYMQVLNVLHQVLISGTIPKWSWPPRDSNWPRYLWLIRCSHWTEFMETWQKSSTQRLLQRLWFAPIRNSGHPGYWLAYEYSTPPLQPQNGIGWNVTGKQVLLWGVRWHALFFWWSPTWVSLSVTSELRKFKTVWLEKYLSR